MNLYTVEKSFQIGERIRDLRNQRGYSLRVLSERSGLNINTLSLIENGKTSPSVSTLQLLAGALDFPLVSFFESEVLENEIVYTPTGTGAQSPFGSTTLRNLAADLHGGNLQSFEVTLPAGNGSGDRMIVHTGLEWVYCLAGEINYRIQEIDYILSAGDTLTFEAHLPHRWENQSKKESRILLTLFTDDRREDPVKSHFHKYVL